MRRTQRWTPDTHPETYFEIEWDDADAGYSVVIDGVVSGITSVDLAGDYARVQAENRAIAAARAV